MELQLDDTSKLEAIFGLCLLKVQSIELWGIYIDHIRRKNDVLTDVSGQGRQVVNQAYEFVIDQVGQDKDSGQLWRDYIEFMKSGPGVPGGGGWQDAQKMDFLRKAYQRAVCVPMSSVALLWKDYDQFEMGLNKTTVSLTALMMEQIADDSAGPENDAGKVPSIRHCAQLVHYAAEHDGDFATRRDPSTAATPWLRRLR